MSQILKKEVGPLYDKISDWFDENRGRSLMEKKYLDIALQRAGKDASVLDLGCGAAEPIAAYFIAAGLKVTGVDISGEMIKMCYRKFPEQEWITSDIRCIQLSRHFDIIMAWDSFFHLDPDAQRAMFPIFAAHATKGAILIFNTGGAYGEVFGNMQGHDFYHASLDGDEYRDLLGKNGFDIVNHTSDDKDCGGRTVWVAAKQ